MAAQHVTVVTASGPPQGGVVLLQEAFGVTSYLLDVADRLAREGWSSAIPHLYHRSGSPTFAYDVDQGEGVDNRKPDAEAAAGAAIGPHALQLTEAGVVADVDDAIAALGELGISPTSIGVIGFCFGGSVALFTAGTRALGAAVVYYGAGIQTPHFSVPAFTDVAANRRTPLLALYGAHDLWISTEDVAALEEALARSPVPGELVRFAEAGHGFHCDLRSSYHQPSAEAAWQRTLDWLRIHAGRVTKV